MTVWAAVDVGGTSIKTGTVHGLDVAPGPTFPALADGDRTTVLGALADAVRSAVDRSGVPDLAVSVPGPFDHTAGMSRMSHKFAAISGVELRPWFARAGAIGRIHFVDDAEAMALGAVHHARPARRRVLVIALGTGFGSALVVDGRPVRAVDDVVVGRLWERVADDGRALDRIISATGLAAALGVPPDELAARVGRSRGDDATIDAWARLAGRELARCVHDVRAEQVLVAGGASPVVDLVRDVWTSELGVEIERVDRPGLALLGAALDAQAANT